MAFKLLLLDQIPFNLLPTRGQGQSGQCVCVSVSKKSHHPIDFNETKEMIIEFISITDLYLI